MAENFPGPGELRFYYTTAGRIHSQRFNCRIDGTPAPGTLDEDCSILRRDDIPVTLPDAADSWAQVLKLFLADESTIDYCELWRYAPGSTDGEFVSVTAVGVSGVVAAAVSPAHQQTYTFRTAEGGIMKIIMLETTSTANSVTSMATPPGGALDTLLDFVINSETSIFLGRDTSHIVAGLRRSQGQNEKLFRKVFRNT